MITNAAIGTDTNFFAGGIRAVYEGNGDAGSAHTWFITEADPVTVYCYTGGAHVTSKDFPTAYGQAASWLAFDTTDGVFKSGDRSNGYWYFYDGTMWATESATWFITNTWRDSDAIGSTHETVQGPPATITMKKRARITVTTPPIPSDSNNANRDDPNSVSIYVGRVDGTRTNQWRQAMPADGVRTATITSAIFSNADTLHPNPPLAGDFPNATPALISSELTDSFGPLTWFDGVGGGRWKGEFPDTDWIYPSLTGGWANYGGADEEFAYRRWRGQLFVKGLIKDGSAGVAFFTLPVGYRIVDPARTPSRRQFSVLSSAGTSALIFYDDHTIRVPLLGGAGTYANLADVPPQIIYG
jgi:hypothetical protein